MRLGALGAFRRKGNPPPSGGGAALSLDGDTGFIFDAQVLGQLPTAIGFVWTDGLHGSVGSLETTILDSSGNELQHNSADASFLAVDSDVDSHTQEDRFFGFVAPQGIAEVKIATIGDGGGGIELDHVQFGQCQGVESALAASGLTVGTISYAYTTRFQYSGPLPPSASTTPVPSTGTTVGQNIVIAQSIPAGTSVPTQVGGSTTTVDLVVSLGWNHPPSITSSAPTTVPVAGQAFTHEVKAYDQDIGDTVGFYLLQAVQGMTLDERSGLLSWTPGLRQLGPVTVKLMAMDEGGLSDEQTFTLVVTGTNQAPTFGSTPPSQATEGEWYAYPMWAGDPDPGDGAQLAFSLDTAPAGMSLVSGSIAIWQPTSSQVGGHGVTARVSDPAGDFDTQSYTITVADVPSAPRFTSPAPVSAKEGVPYVYDVQVIDDDVGHVLTYSAPVRPTGFSIDGATGAITWTPTPQNVGTEAVLLRVVDETGLEDYQAFTVSVTPVNDPPSIISTPLTNATHGGAYRYQARATDPEGDALVFSLIQGPTGMVVSSSGLVEWTALGLTADVTLEVRDTGGLVDTQTFQIAVSPDTTAPSVQVTAQPRFVLPGETSMVTVQASDTGGISTRTLTVDGQAVSLDANGQAVITTSAPGVIQLVGAATDPAGNSGTATETIGVRDTSDITAPTAVPQAPSEGSIITAPTTIIGTVEDDNLAIYRLTIAQGDRGTPVEFASGTAAVTNGPLGVLDPTLLENGLYQIGLEVEDVNGAMTSTTVTVQVEGNMKIGVFTLGFTDLQVPVAGVPLTVTRTYDSRVKSTRDFGVGWDLSVSAGRFEHNRELSTGWYVPPQRPIGMSGIYIPCFHQVDEVLRHTTEVRLSDAERYTFAPQLVNGSRIGAGCLFEVQYTQVGCSRKRTSWVTWSRTATTPTTGGRARRPP